MDTFSTACRRLPLHRIAASVGLVILLGAAGQDDMHVQMSGVAPLAQPEPVPMAAPAKTLTFQNTMYQSAPVPDEDVEPPRGQVRTEAQLSPKFLVPDTLYQGDGYSYASSQQGTLERRKSGAAGLGLSVPVSQ